MIVNGMPLDLLFIDRGSSTTLVMFHAALSSAATRIPAFKGMGVSADTGVNLIALADPTIGMGDIDLAWFLGNEKTGYLPPLLAPLIQHLIKQTSGENTILFGTSGGGYAAVNFARFFPNCFCLAALPRLDLTKKPEALAERYLDIAFPTSTPEAKAHFKVAYVDVPLYEQLALEGMSFDLGLFHNLGDKTFFTYQVLPFVEALSDEPRLFTRVEWYGRGHIIVPGQPYRDIVGALATNFERSEAIREAGFAPTRKRLSRLAE